MLALSVRKTHCKKYKYNIYIYITLKVLNNLFYVNILTCDQLIAI